MQHVRVPCFRTRNNYGVWHHTKNMCSCLEGKNRMCLTKNIPHTNTHTHTYTHIHTQTYTHTYIPNINWWLSYQHQKYLTYSEKFDILLGKLSTFLHSLVFCWESYQPSCKVWYFVGKVINLRGKFGILLRKLSTFMESLVFCWERYQPSWKVWYFVGISIHLLVKFGILLGKLSTFLESWYFVGKVVHLLGKWCVFQLYVMFCLQS